MIHIELLLSLGRYNTQTQHAPIYPLQLIYRNTDSVCLELLLT